MRVAPREVVVDGDQVGTLTGERVQVEWQRGDEGLSFPGRHLGDLPLMQHDPADQLHVVGHHVPGESVAGHDNLGAEEAPGRLPHGRERLRQEVVQARLRLARQLRFGGRQLAVELETLVSVRTVVLRLFQARHLAR